MEFLLGLYIGMNIIGAILIVLLVIRDDVWAVMLYPSLEDILKYEYNFSSRARKVITWCFTILFFPMVVFYYFVLIIMLLMYSVIIVVDHFIRNVILKEN